VLLEQSQVELPFAGEVLVEDRFADAGALGDVVHRRGMETLGHEDVLRGTEELTPARTPRQARGTPGGLDGGA
jgi:hypothetical protein